MPAHSAIRRDVGAFALMLTGLGSIIGSGWLFGAWHAAQLAGPGAIYAWLIGAAIITSIALTYSELGAMFPESGGMVRYGHYSHGSLVGFIAAWSNWIAIVSVVPVEAEASVQYMASWPWAWAQDLVRAPAGRARRADAAGPRDRRGAGRHLFPGQLLERQALRAHELGDHGVQADRAGARPRSR